MVAYAPSKQKDLSNIKLMHPWKTEEGCRRRRGRPKLTWGDNIKRDVKGAEVNSRQWERMAEDHD